MANKITNKMVLTYVRDNFDLPDGYAEKVESMIAALDRKNSAERKPTAKQTENEGVRAAVVDVINANSEGDGFTCADLIAQCPAVAGRSNQYVSAIMRQAVLAGEVSKGSVKRKTYFAPVGVYVAEDEGE